MPIGPSLPSPMALLFNKLARGLLPKFKRPPMLFDNDESNHTVFNKRQSSIDIHNRSSQKYPVFMHRINCSSAVGR